MRKQNVTDDLVLLFDSLMVSGGN